ncbi:uncharacterized protein LOC144477995, partial [Augochlora pura]
MSGPMLGPTLRGYLVPKFKSKNHGVDGTMEAPSYEYGYDWTNTNGQTQHLLMDSEDEDDASDVGTPGPGVLAADLSAMDRRVTYDEPGNATGQEYDIYMDLPVREQIKCSICAGRSRLRDRRFLGENDWAKHMAEQHPDTRIGWRCGGCRRIFPGMHNCKCHIPKCKGSGTGAAIDGLSCPTCGSVFSTKRGLSQHERIRHPVVRNQERIAQASVSARPVNRASVWSKEETETLVRLNEIYKNEKQPNAKIHQILTTKTAKQISDKRRLLFAPVREEIEEPVVPESPPSSSRTREVENRESFPEPLETSEWKEEFRAAIQSCLLEEDNDLKYIENRIRELAIREIQPDPLEIEQTLEYITDMIKIDGAKKNNQKNKNKRANKESDRARFGKYRYARFQELYKKCPRKLIDMAVAGEGIEKRKHIELPEKEQIGKLYGDLWGTCGPESGLPTLGGGPSMLSPINEIWSPVAVEEIITKMRKIKNDTAAGVDGITKPCLRRKGLLQTLAKFYNLLMLFQIYPAQWRVNRTTLIPKPGKSVEDVKNWRPITIGSLLGRIFSSLLERRLRSKIVNSIRQKGFTKEDGCKHNISILAKTIKEMKEKTGGVVTVVDISKAFDTVPHSAIEDGLKCKGIPAMIRKYIRGMYLNCQTEIKAKSGSVKVTQKRGVKQGDPLSPLLFNTIIDPIIDHINETTEGIMMGDEN